VTQDRYLTREDRSAGKPVHAVWEITLACDLKCNHCGSRAGTRRPDELSTEECLDVVAQLARLGVREVTIIGGEAYMRKDWLQIIRAIRSHGMLPTMQSGGRSLDEKKIIAMKEAGLDGAGISIDGPRELHDRLRGVEGSYDAAMEALRLLKKHGLRSSVNTQIGAEVIPHLRSMMHDFIAIGAKNWQIQLTVAMGNAADNDDLLLQPYQILELHPLLADLYLEGKKHGFTLRPGNNIGYFGPYEHLWRGDGREDLHWNGCNAGQNTMGIEADGKIKGCPSLPSNGYTGGNVRDMSIEDIWNTTPELAFTRERTKNDLWGFCRTCYYADVCRSGCSWTSTVMFGRAGNNPYCHHRTLELKKEGLRERVVKVKPAPGEPFDHGLFEIVVEPIDAALPKKRNPLPIVV
jgi:radical SAM protein with 4Fe4S-binding SPASM domain